MQFPPDESKTGVSGPEPCSRSDIQKAGMLVCAHAHSTWRSGHTPDSSSSSFSKRNFMVLQHMSVFVCTKGINGKPFSSVDSETSKVSLCLKQFTPLHFPRLCSWTSSYPKRSSLGSFPSGRKRELRAVALEGHKYNYVSATTREGAEEASTFVRSFVGRQLSAGFIRCHWHSWPVLREGPF